MIIKRTVHIEPSRGTPPCFMQKLFLLFEFVVLHRVPTVMSYSDTKRHTQNTNIGW